MKFQMNNTKTSDHHKTPKRVYDYFKTFHNIDLKNMYDPCKFKSKINTLRYKWKKENYINPPYSKIIEFCEHADILNRHLGKKMYLLIPLSKSDQPFFHLYLKRHKIIFIPFRIKFVGSKQPSPQTHCLVIMK